MFAYLNCLIIIIIDLYGCGFIEFRWKTGSIKSEVIH